MMVIAGRGSWLDPWEGGCASMDDEPTAADAQLRSKIANPETRLSSALHIGIAIGILVERHRIAPDDGFDMLLKAGATQGRRVSDVADDLVHDGVLERA